MIVNSLSPLTGLSRYTLHHLILPCIALDVSTEEPLVALSIKIDESDIVEPYRVLGWKRIF